MDLLPIPSRTYPECGSGDYAFRSRKNVIAVLEKGEPEATETKYRCKSCGHEWKVRVPTKDVR